MLAVYRRFCDPVQETPDPLGTPYSDRLAGEQELLAVLEVLDIEGWRGYEVDVDGLPHAHIVLNDGVGDRDHDGGGRVC